MVTRVGRVRTRGGSIGAGIVIVMVASIVTICYLFELPFDAAQRHKRNVSEIACTALLEERRPILGVLYDEIARCRLNAACAHGLSWFHLSRTSWAEKASKCGTSFKVADEAAEISENLLRRARRLHDRLFAAVDKEANQV